TNVTAAPVTATVTVTPTANECVGTPTNFTVTVNPRPGVNAVANRTLCNGDSGAAINFSSPLPVAGTTFSWTVLPNVGFGTNGTGNIPAYSATNAGTSPVTATVTYTATANGCVGGTATFTVTVNPTPTVN